MGLRVPSAECPVYVEGAKNSKHKNREPPRREKSSKTDTRIFLEADQSMFSFLFAFFFYSFYTFFPSFVYIFCRFFLFFVVLPVGPTGSLEVGKKSNGSIIEDGSEFLSPRLRTQALGVRINEDNNSDNFNEVMPRCACVCVSAGIGTQREKGSPNSRDHC